MKKNNLTKHWTKKAEDVLLNRKIVKVEYLTEKEANIYMWYSRPVSFILDNGTRIIAQRDDEGNDGGVLWAGLSESTWEILPVLGLDN